jgi:hypothetical protein
MCKAPYLKTCSLSSDLEEVYRNLESVSQHITSLYLKRLRSLTSDDEEGYKKRTRPYPDDATTTPGPNHLSVRFL